MSRERLLEGVVQHSGRFAFLLSEVPGEPDVYLRGPGLRTALDGDRVRVRLMGAERGRRVGEIVSVLSRARETVVGALRRAGRFWALIPEGGEEPDAWQVKGFAKGLRPEEGLLASLRVERWPTEQRGGGGSVEEILGRPDDPAARFDALLISKGVPLRFPEHVLEEASALPDEPAPADWAGRRELFELPVFTIDGEDAKDFDDAVSLEPLERGRARLGVHIADVAEYVRPGTALDDEAVRRGTSVYLPGRVIPMLPPKLSDGLCSLRPDVPRLTLSCWIELDERGRPQHARCEESVIRSWRRFTYEEVQRVLDGGTVERVRPEVSEALTRMGRLAKALTAERLRRGALDSAVPEHYVKVDAQGRPLEVLKRPRLDSHRLIEEFMLAANEAVARTLTKARVPFLRRLHEDPDPAKLADLQEELGKLGLRAPTSLVAHPVKGLQGLLEAAKGHPFEETANVMVIRSMKLARYSCEPGGHFGLASKDYCHFTSPIRRYPDLFVHRALKGLLRGKPKGSADGLESLALKCSERERAAQDAERRAVDLARARLLGRRVGQEFEALAMKAGPSGVFVSLPESGAWGRLSGAQASPGARLRVRLVSVDALTGRLEFEPASGGLPSQPRVGKWRRRG